MTRVRLPEGRQFAVTWSIPDAFGGMTEALLRRSAAFHRVGGVEVDVLTFDARPDTPRLEQALRDRGELEPGVRVTNLYDWLRGHPLPGGSLRLDRDAFTPLDATDATTATHATDATEARWSGDLVMSRARTDHEGRVLQVDHYRDDGTLLLTDRRDTRMPGVPGGRSIVLCDAEGRPTRSWRSIWPLYRAWLDALTAGEPSYLIVDSKTIAPFMRTYHRPHVITAHVVHASHRSAAGEAHPIRESRREVFEHLDDFDLVVLLTKRQRADVEGLLGRNENLAVIPNVLTHVPAPPTSPASPRDPDLVVVLAALTPRKRVSHAIEAVQAVNAARPSGPSLRLDVFGDGENRAALERRITDPAAVRLRGFDPGARQQLARASFLLLTSHSEGFPLVLIESMAAGCLPIAYDVPYGPSDLIRDGRNGILVPPGDVEALASALARARTLPPRRIAAMRRRAVRSAQRYDDERVVALWSGELRRAAARRRLRRSTRFRSLRAGVARTPLAIPLRSVALALNIALDRARRPTGKARRIG